VKEVMEKHGTDGDTRGLWSEAAIGLEDIVRDRKIVNWETNADVQNEMRNAIEEYLFELKDKRGLNLTFDEVDAIMEQCLDIAKLRIR
jgi:type I restriction enzyme R subunit